MNQLLVWCKSIQKFVVPRHKDYVLVPEFARHKEGDQYEIIVNGQRILAMVCKVGYKPPYDWYFIDTRHQFKE